jgi:hypothetical protein
MRKVAIGAAAFVVAVPLSFLGNSSAHAATTCYAKGCYNLPAASTTCVNDAYVAEQANIYDGSAVVGNVQLKYSPSCRATWARVVQTGGVASFGEILSTGPYGPLGCNGGVTPGTGCNTNMVDDLNPLQSWAYGALYYPYATESAKTSPPF